MINFNGTTKRRNINLSGNRKPLKSINNSYLEQLNQERANRSKAKQDLNAAIKIQSAIRRYQHLKQEAISLEKIWDPRVVHCDTALRQFTFIARNLPVCDIGQVLTKLVPYYKTIDLNEVNNTTFANFFISLVQLYSRILREQSNEIFTTICDIVEIISLSGVLASKQSELPFKSLLQSLNDTMTRFSSQGTKLIVKTLFQYSQYDLLSLINFFSLDYSLTLMDGAYLSKVILLRDWIATLDWETDLSDETIFQFLGNFISLISDNNIFEPSSTTIRAFSHILKSIHSEICFIADLENDYPMTEDEESVILVADYTLTEKIEQLYSKRLMDFFFKDLESADSFEDFSEFLYSSLHLLNSAKSGPTNTDLKNKLLANVVVSSSCLQLMHYQFQDVLIPDPFATSLIDENFNGDLKLSESQMWWENLYSMEEVFSYTLMFQNDKSIFRFNDDNMLAIIVTFLKSFCLHTAINGRSIRNNLDAYPISAKDFDHITKLSFKLFNQLYLRNIRMHFVDDDFWSMRKSIASTLRFNTETVIDLLKRKDSNTDDADDFVSRRRTPNSFREESSGALQILIYMPFLIPFETRAQIFQSLIESDRLKKLNNYGAFFLEPQTRLHATISRENLLFDAFEAFGDMSGEQFKSKLDVTFVNKFGPESGIDGGGLTKEFLTSVCKDGFQYVNFDDETLNRDSNSPDYNFFKQTPDTYQLYPSTDFYWRAKYQQQQTKLHDGKLLPEYDFNEENQFFCKMMRFLGMVIGKCLYENILLDISFAPFFLFKWCSLENVEGGNQQSKNSFDDLKYLDKNLYENLIKMLSLSEEGLRDLELYFSISEKLPHQSEIVTVDLIPNGSTIQVDQSNKLQYLYAVANFKLNTLINTQTKYFLSGLFEIIQPSWLNLFSHVELLMLVSGGEKPVDVADLKANTEYGGYLETDLTIIYFWEVLEEFSPEDRSKLVKFVTSSPKAPLLGFKDLTPKFGIRDALDVRRLPTASTCVNLLKLPDYKNKKILKEKLLYAINAGSGFDLS